MRAIKILALSLLMIAVIISGWFYLALLSAEKTVLNYNYYEELLLETNPVEIIVAGERSTCYISYKRCSAYPVPLLLRLAAC